VATTDVLRAGQLQVPPADIACLAVATALTSTMSTFADAHQPLDRFSITYFVAVCAVCCVRCFVLSVMQAAYKQIDFAALEADVRETQAVCALTQSPIVFGHCESAVLVSACM
jgi:hypothetical protein